MCAELPLLPLHSQPARKEDVINRMKPEILLTDQPLAPPPLRFADDAGGVVEFYGVVRGREGNSPITAIRYEAFPDMARHQLVNLALEATNRFPILGLILQHRIGLVPVAEPSLFLRVTSAHRGPAFEAAEWLIVELKRRVPIWKHPVNREMETFN